ncbi:5707_t:CDS:2 [Funneliformis mosseae]|uniref:5707_t:CDS:1 n=1 Tax=Funneliformis mosseae TaxID=27381 RepID=A0A9N8VEV1_FUNMO|nr:5707_t:CDS:2 [Funneliformis mosseae]
MHEVMNFFHPNQEFFGDLSGTHYIGHINSNNPINQHYKTQHGYLSLMTVLCKVQLVKISRLTGWSQPLTTGLKMVVNDPGDRRLSPSLCNYASDLLYREIKEMKMNQAYRNGPIERTKTTYIRFSILIFKTKM